MPLRPLKAFKAFKALFVEYVSATQDSLLLESQVIIANGAWLLIVEPFQRLSLYVLPLLLTQWQSRLLNQAQPLR